MWTDVVDLRDFYATSLGQSAQRLVRHRIRAMWPDVTGQRVLGLGYVVPYLRPFHEQAERVMAVMPASQGVLHWPRSGPNQVALADEAELPFPDSSIDRVLLVHALECSEQVRPMLREAWRVLAGGGRLLIVVPNRRGIWARLDRGPFGHGQPYTVSQLSRLLRDNLFTPIAATGSLFAPPSHSRMMLAAAPAWERLGSRWFKTFAGVVLIEASKQIYAASPALVVKRKRRAYLPIGQSSQRGMVKS
ncbi:MAG: methyltransferase domain-containing protein [Proteobacteria bacterium]|nr:methyltransferase domain-containing protein [Pseudomonadota bacterium]